MTDEPITGRNPPRLSIFLLIRSLNVGGSERQLVQLAEALKARGHDVTVAVYYSGGVLEEPLRRLGVPLLDLRKRGRWDFFGFALRLAKAVRKARPDVLYSFLGTSNLLSAAIRPLIPSVRRVWSVRAADIDLAAYDRFTRLSYRMECALAGGADAIISNSVAGSDHAVANGFPAGKMHVVPNGIDVDRFRPDAAARRRMRAFWGVADHEVLIGNLARIDPLKDYPTFLNVARLVTQRHPEARFVCIGEGEPAISSRLRDLSDRLGLHDKVIWAGRSDDPPAALNALDIFCSTSVTEGFSNSLAEALACGLPCVATDVGDSAMILGPAGRCVPPRDPEAFAEALLQTIRELGSFDKDRARRRVVQCFSVEALVENTVRVLTTGLAGRKQSGVVRPIRPAAKAQGGPDA